MGELQTGTNNPGENDIKSTPVLSPGDFDLYDKGISNISSLHSVDKKTVNRHLVKDDETMKQPGGDVTRQIQQQIGSKATRSAHMKKRSSSFSYFLTESRRQSTASDINVPGGFRREFLINKSLKENKRPPNFLSRNFVEFLSIYGHFAGEDMDDESPEDEEFFDEETPLILRDPNEPPIRKLKATAGLVKTFFLVFKAIVGPGILILPRAFCDGGLLFSSIVLIIFSFLTFMSYFVLIKAKNILNKTSYGELGYLTYGRKLRTPILFSIVFSQIGFVATYFLFTALNLLSFFKEYLQLSSDLLSVKNLVIVQSMILLPFILVRNFAKFSIISLVSSVFILVGLAIVVSYSLTKLVKEGMGDNVVNFNPRDWPLLVGVAVTAFEGIGLILPIESSMAEPHKFTRVLFFVMAFITFLFILVGALGYSTYGDSIKTIVLLNLPQNDSLVQSVVFFYSLAALLSAPLQLFPVNKTLESLFFNAVFVGKKGPEDQDNYGRLYRSSGRYSNSVKWLKNLFRTVLLCAVSVISYLNADNLDKFISFNGSFACIPLVFIYPPLIHARAIKTGGQGTWKTRLFQAFDYTLAVVGFTAVIYTTYQIVFTL